MRLEGRAAALPVAEVRRRQLDARSSRVALRLPELHEALGVREGQRPHQHVVGDREGGRGRADAERGHHHDGEREARRGPAQRAERSAGPGAGCRDARARRSHATSTHGAEPERERPSGPVRVAPAPREDARASRRRIRARNEAGQKPQERAVERASGPLRREARSREPCARASCEARASARADGCPERRDPVVAPPLVVVLGRRALARSRRSARPRACAGSSDRACRR